MADTTKPTPSWRDVLVIHPAAEMFPRLPPNELKVLGKDIRARGLIDPITVIRRPRPRPDGRLNVHEYELAVIDGINRLDAMEGEGFKLILDGKLDKNLGHKAFGLEPAYGGGYAELDSDIDPVAFVIARNIHRRHLTTEQKRELIGKLLVADPNKSDRQVAKAVKVSPTFVGKVRAEKEATGNVSTVDTRTDSKGRQQPAHRTTNPPSKMVNSESVSVETIILKNHLGEDVSYPKPQGKPTFNRQDNHQIGWAGFSWNVVTGCLHTCPYCYAREGAENNPNLSKFYPAGFTPLFHCERLDAPANTKVPNEAKDDPRLGRVFVGSMGDMFGKWVPDEWIEAVFAKCIENPQWQYLFLSKFPQRYVGLQLPPTAWIGTTVDEQYRVKIAEDAFRKISGVRVKWLSLEPLREPLEFTDMSMFDWVVIGAQSATNQPPPVGHVPEFSPPFEWVMNIVVQARAAGCRIWMKENLLGNPHPQSPGMKLIQELPAYFDPPPADDGLDILPSLRRDASASEAPR